MSRVDPEEIKIASNALLSWWKKQTADKHELVESSEVVSLILSLKRVPGNPSNKPKLIPVPHSLHFQDGSANDLCLIVKDPSKPIKEKLGVTPVPGFVKVIGLDKLRKNYGQYQEKLELLKSYHSFFADQRILPSLSKALGKKFFVKKKQPVPVNVTKEDLAGELTRARDSTCFYMPFGSCAAVRVGTTSFTVKQLTENIVSALPAIIALIPKKWKNIQGIFLKSDSSVSLPLFTTAPGVRSAAATGESAGVRDEEAASGDSETEPEDSEEEEEEEDEEDVVVLKATGGGKPAVAPSKQVPTAKLAKASAPKPTPAAAAAKPSAVKGPAAVGAQPAKAAGKPGAGAKAAGKPTVAAPAAASIPVKAKAVAAPAKPAAAVATKPVKVTPPDAAPAAVKPAPKLLAMPSTAKVSKVTVKKTVEASKKRKPEKSAPSVKKAKKAL